MQANKEINRPKDYKQSSYTAMFLDMTDAYFGIPIRLILCSSESLKLNGPKMQHAVTFAFNFGLFTKALKMRKVFIKSF